MICVQKCRLRQTRMSVHASLRRVWTEAVRVASHTHLKAMKAMPTFIKDP